MLKYEEDYLSHQMITKQIANALKEKEQQQQSYAMPMMQSYQDDYMDYEEIKQPTTL